MCNILSPDTGRQKNLLALYCRVSNGEQILLKIQRLRRQQVNIWNIFKSDGGPLCQGCVVNNLALRSDSTLSITVFIESTLRICVKISFYLLVGSSPSARDTILRIVKQIITQSFIHFLQRRCEKWTFLCIIWVSAWGIFFVLFLYSALCH